MGALHPADPGNTDRPAGQRPAALSLPRLRLWLTLPYAVPALHRLGGGGTGKDPRHAAAPRCVLHRQSRFLGRYPVARRCDGHGLRGQIRAVASARDRLAVPAQPHCLRQAREPHGRGRADQRAEGSARRQLVGHRVPRRHHHRRQIAAAVQELDALGARTAPRPACSSSPWCSITVRCPNSSAG